ncbi:MAG: TRZ/ATZ family hydrolase [Betaproteobacteria bacterium]|nr:TRZ/ATZ family hydrolase [Betaproteobacteria bacterium]
MSSRQPVDLIIQPRWIIPVEPYGQTLEDHSVVVNAGRILVLCPRHEAITRFTPAEHVILDEHVLIPGLVNLHTHAAMTLMRGIADDLPLMRWLHEAIWPIEQQFVSPEFVRDGTALAAAEMLLGGITCANDMYFYPDAAATAFAEAGMRAVIGIFVVDFPSDYASNCDDYIEKGLSIRDSWRGHPLLEFSFAPHAPYTVPDTGFRRIIQLAHELDAPVHLHLHETHEEIRASLEQHGKRPLAHLAGLGLLETDLIVAHAIHLQADEIAILAKNNASVAHCPSSNMKLASGIAPTVAMLEQGLRVGLGTDGAASNNRLDLFEEMRQAGLLAKVASGRAEAFPAHALLRAATLGGAAALRLDDQIGSITAGKAADLVAIRLDDLPIIPVFNPAGHIPYVADRRCVSDVWVAGKQRVRQHVPLQTHNKELLQRIRVWQNRLKTLATGQ